MKIGLQYTVGTIHRAKCADIQDFIATAGIRMGAGACTDESAPILGQKQGLLAC